MNIGLVQAVLDSALRRAAGDGTPAIPTTARTIRGCTIALGELAELEPEVFIAEWRRLARGTRAENSELYFHRLPGELQCMACFQRYHPSGLTPLCPQCGSVGAKVLKGEECFVESIQIEDALTPFEDTAGTRA